MNPTTIQTASRQYANRPTDERFPSLDAMIADAIADKNHLCDREPDRYETFDGAIERADTHYTAETDADGPDDANDCPECARSNGPHYRGPCSH